MATSKVNVNSKLKPKAKAVIKKPKLFSGLYKKLTTVNRLVFKGLFLFAVVIGSIAILYSTSSGHKATPESVNLSLQPNSKLTTTSPAINITQAAIFQDINLDRAAAGLKILTENTALNNASIAYGDNVIASDNAHIAASAYSTFANNAGYSFKLLWADFLWSKDSDSVIARQLELPIEQYAGSTITDIGIGVIPDNPQYLIIVYVGTPTSTQSQSETPALIPPIVPVQTYTYTPITLPSGPSALEICQSTKASDTSQYDSTLNSDNESYTNESNQLTGEIEVIDAHGGGGSSQEIELEDELTQLQDQYQQTIQSLYSQYQEELAELNC